MIEQIVENKEIGLWIDRADFNLESLGYTEHGNVHCMRVASVAKRILKELKYDDKLQEMVEIAGYMHDIGNAVNRKHHAEYGAILANDLLKKVPMEISDRIMIVSAIANHDETTGGANDVLSAALIIADKTDVRRNRVRDKGNVNFDIHDKVNYAVRQSELTIDVDKRSISLNLDLDEDICTMYEYFEIFLGRMMMCRKAAEILGSKFRLLTNGTKIL